MKKTYYFDCASATPIDPDVARKMHQLEDAWGNISAQHSQARLAKKVWDEALSAIADILKIKPSEIIITSGGTESNNSAIHGVMQADEHAQMLYLAIEHPSIGEKAQQYNSREVKVDKKGVLDLADLKKKINDNIKLISVMQVNNEIGTIQPVQDVAQAVKEIKIDRQNRGVNLPLYLHTDSCQATNYVSVLPHRLGVDMMSINSGKIYGPKGVGMLYVSSKIKEFTPLLVGGGQQSGRRSGTEDAVGAYGFALALKKATQGTKLEEKRVSGLRDRLIKALKNEFPEVVINGSLSRRIANNVNVSFPGHDNETLMLQLDELGISVATGSACSASSEEPSHVLGAIGASETVMNSALRITLGRQTDDQSINFLIKSLK